MKYREQDDREQFIRERIKTVDPDNVAVTVSDLKDGYFSISIYDIKTNCEFSLVVAKTKTPEKAMALGKEMRVKFLKKFGLEEIKKQSQFTFCIADQKHRRKKKKNPRVRNF